MEEPKPFSRTTFSFANEIFVKCPKCNNLGIVTVDLSRWSIFNKENIIKYTCNSCSYTDASNKAKFPIPASKPIDPFFGFDLWLQTTFKSNVLWCYNLNHLNYIRNYLSSKLRQDNDRGKYSLVSNLPKWMVQAKNKKAILRKLNKLQSGLLAHKVRALV